VYEAWKLVKANGGAGGVDGETIETFELNLKGNLYKIWNRMSAGSYFPAPVRGVEIPKANGKVRLLGIPTIADRVAQTVVRARLERLLEPLFHEDSYAYRNGKSAHGAIETVRKRCWKYDWVLEFDIEKAFDNIDHSLMMQAVRKHAEDRWVIMYIERWLTSPILDPHTGEMKERSRGTPQGGVISPLLFNLYFHYAFDLWMKRKFSSVPFVRYADDGLVHCRSMAQAKMLLTAIKERLKECGVELQTAKTRIVLCRDANRRHSAEHTQFTFLGFTFRGRLAKSNEGKYFNSFSPAISRSAAISIRKTMRTWNIGRWTNATLEMIACKVNAELRGWWNYYGKYSRQETRRVLNHLDQILRRWAQRKYKHIHSDQGAREWLRKVAQREPSLFVHWQLRMGN
jgi:group II intron reverse transcriptase/maturase